MGQIRKRGGVYWIRYYRNGQRFEESARSDKYEDARSLLRRKEGDVENGVPVGGKIGKLRLSDAAKDLITNYTINEKRSTADVERHVAKLKAFFGDGARMADMTTADTERYAEHRQKQGAANATINRELAALTRMFSLALRGRKLAHKPVIPKLAENNVRKGFFEREQFEAVRAQLLRPRVAPAVAAVATMAYYTGWRTQSEILTLEWSQVDRKAGVIRLDVGSTKNKSGRTFKYVRVLELRDAIEAQWEAHELLKKKGTICPYVFQRNGKRVKSYRKAWKAACEAAGIPGRIPHDFRRTAVRNLTRAGVTDTIAMRVTGHKTRAVFDRYDITSEADLDDAAAKLQELVGTNSGTIGGSSRTANPHKASA